MDTPILPDLNPYLNGVDLRKIIQEDTDKMIERIFPLMEVTRCASRCCCPCCMVIGGASDGN